MRGHHPHTHLPRRAPLTERTVPRSRAIDADKRRAALIATAVTLPVIVIAGLLFGSLSGGSGGHGSKGALTPISASAPPLATQEAAPCTRLLEYLPVRLGTLAQRKVNTTPETPFVVAWGDPAIVMRCGVDKPKTFTPTSTDQVFPGGDIEHGAWYWVDRPDGANVYTAIDREAYVSFTLPDKYQGADYLPLLNAAVIKAMPKAVCSTSESELDASKLCANRAS